MKNPALELQKTTRGKNEEPGTSSAGSSSSSSSGGDNSSFSIFC